MQYEGDLQRASNWRRLHAKDPACSHTVIECAKDAKRLKTSSKHSRKRCVFKDQEMKRTAFVDSFRPQTAKQTEQHSLPGKIDGSAYEDDPQVRALGHDEELLRSPSSRSVLRWRSWTSSTTMTYNGRPFSV
jgi:hypothetical protein